MKAAEIRVGGVYVAKVSGGLTRVRIIAQALGKGWEGENLATLRRVHIRSAARLRREVTP